MSIGCFYVLWPVSHKINPRQRIPLLFISCCPTMTGQERCSLAQLGEVHIHLRSHCQKTGTATGKDIWRHMKPSFQTSSGLREDHMQREDSSLFGFPFLPTETRRCWPSSVSSSFLKFVGVWLTQLSPSGPCTPRHERKPYQGVLRPL